MKNRIIITGHGAYASGIKSTIELIAGVSDEVTYIDFPAGDSSVMLMEKMSNAQKHHPEDRFLFMCDLLGGTPFKLAAELSVQHPRTEVVAGCNLGAMIETILQKDNMELDELANFVIGVTKRSVVRFVQADVETSQPRSAPAAPKGDAEGI